MVQAAFNLGNAMGAYVGGVPFDYDMSIAYVTIFGAVLAAIGAYALFLYYTKHESYFADLKEVEDDENNQDGISMAPSTAAPSHDFGMSNQALSEYHAARAAEYAELAEQEKHSKQDNS